MYCSSISATVLEMGDPIAMPLSVWYVTLEFEVILT